MKFTEQDALDYMEKWIDSDQWQDITIMYDYSETEMLAEYLVSAGAINSKLCYEHDKEIEQYIEKMAKKFKKLSNKKQQKYYNTLFKDTLIIDCQDCNHVSFINNGNEELYPEVKEHCWSCKSKNIKTQRGI